MRILKMEMIDVKDDFVNDKNWDDWYLDWWQIEMMIKFEKEDSEGVGLWR